jgi:hypothetical protein
MVALLLSHTRTEQVLKVNYRTSSRSEPGLPRATGQPFGVMTARPLMFPS